MTALSTLGATCACAVVLVLAMSDGTVPVQPAQATQGPLLESPVRIARDDKSGLLVVGDSRLQRIVTLDAQLRVRSDFAIDGQPLGIAAARGAIFVGNATKGRVEVYDYFGSLTGVLPGKFVKPNDIAIDLEHGVGFVADPGARIVSIIEPRRGNQRAAYAAQIPMGGPDPRVLAMPMAVAVDPANEEVAVSDFGDAATGVDPAIRIFGYDGVLRATITSRYGMLGRRFSRPQGLAYESGKLYLVDSWLSRVLVFDRTTLAQTGSIGTYGTGPGELSLPLDLVIDSVTRDVFVTDNLNHRIALFAGAAQ